VRRLAWLLVPVLAVAGCGGDGAGSTARPEPFPSCAGITAPPAGGIGDSPTATAVATPTPSTTVADVAPSPTSGDQTRADPLPDLALPCFTGADSVSVAAIRGPAVINLWASWCAPCVRELPEMNSYARRAAGRVHVIGVDTRDGRDPARALGEDLGLNFPMLFDESELLRVRLRLAGLPATLFVDADGRIRHVHNAATLDEAGIDRLVRQYLGVTIQ
jgi:thiol-disulfide isomerase/thioredoxin